MVIPGLLVSAVYVFHLLWQQRSGSRAGRVGGFVAIGLATVVAVWPAVVTHPMWRVRTGVPQLAQVQAVCER